MRQTFLTRLLLAAAILFGFALAGCEKDKKPAVVPNLRPEVEITGGAAENQADDYKVEFFWFGYDKDGQVDHFETSVDDTIFTAADTTSQFSRSVRFLADSLSVGGSGTTVSGNFHRWHRFYVRAVDNKHAVSLLDHRTFNAYTIAPFTHFQAPLTSGQVSQFSPTVRFKWLGQDDDSSQPDKKPVGYRYKLVVSPNPLTDWDSGAIQESLGVLRDDGSIDPLHTGYNIAWPDSVLRNPAVPESIKKEWCRTRQTSQKGVIEYWDPVTSVWLRVNDQLEQKRFEDLIFRGYAFSVRAVDEAGAVEPDYERHYSNDSPGNVYIFEALNIPSKPLLTVEEPTLGKFTFPTNGNAVDWEVAANKDLRFGWRADANSYGGEIQGFNYGLDIPDPSSELQESSGIGGWIGWGSWDGNINPIRFPPTDDGVTHYFYVRVRDTRGNEQLGLVRLHVVAFPFDKQILIIDDFANYSGNPTDVDQDGYISRILDRRFTYSDSSQITWINGPGTFPIPQEPASPPTLAFLSRFKMIILYLQESGTNSGDFSVVGDLTSADNIFNARHPQKRRALATYLGAGGKVWVWGVAMTGGLQGDDYDYPKEPFNPAGQETRDPQTFDSNSFLYSMLQIHRGVIQINRGTGATTSNNVLMAAVASPEAAERGYPDVLEIDRTRYTDPNRGIAGCETIQGAPLIIAGLDTLYSYKAKSTSSLYNMKPTALYYRSPTHVQGDLAYFGFYYYFLKEDQVHEMCNHVFMDMFGY